MARDMWLVDNGVDEGTVTANGAEPGLGPDRVQDPRMGKTWRPTVGTQGVLTVTFTSALPMDAIAVVMRNRTAVNSCRLEVKSTAGGPSDVFDGFIDTAAAEVDSILQTAFWVPERDDPTDVVWPVPPSTDPPIPPSAAQIVLTFAQGIDVARVWAGPALWRPMVNHNRGAAQGRNDLGRVQRAPRTGATFTDSAARRRVHDMLYAMIDDTEWDGPLYDLDRRVGTTKQVMFVPNWEYYRPERHAIIGYQQETSPIVAAGWRRFEHGFTILEAG